MRIVYLHQYFVTPAMSGGTRSYEWARRLAERGHEVHVVTSHRSGGSHPSDTVEAGIRVHWLPVRYANSMSLPRRAVAFLRFALAAGREARRVDADLVFATSTPLTVVLPALYAMRGRRSPMVFEVRDLWPAVPIAMGALRNPVLRWAAEALERLAYRHATRVIALSAEMRDGVVAAGFPADAVTVIPNASDTALFRRPGVEAAAEAFRREHEWLGERPLVLYAGTLGKANDVPALVEIAAAARPLHPELRFLIVGEGAEEERVRARAAELGVLDETLFLLPAQPKDRMPDLLAAATVTTSVMADIPALAGNSANKVFDGLAAGRPLATNVGGSLGELVASSGAGVLLSREPDVAARQLTDLVRDEAALVRARAASARLGDEVFSRDVLFGQFERVLTEALAEGRVVRRLSGR